MSRLGMLTPAAGLEGVKDFVLRAVCDAGGNPCPPVVVGVGLGRRLRLRAAPRQRALLRDFGRAPPRPVLRGARGELLAALNKTGNRTAGLRRRTTALRVLINAAPTHIAMLPVAVCISCHAARHAAATL
jgi:fumarate hydratase subunit alpha